MEAKNRTTLEPATENLMSASDEGHPEHPPSRAVPYSVQLAEERARLTADEIVHFDNETTSMGDLMSQDRHTVQRDADGVLRGGYDL